MPRRRRVLQVYGKKVARIGVLGIRRAELPHLRQTPSTKPDWEAIYPDPVLASALRRTSQLRRLGTNGSRRAASDAHPDRGKTINLCAILETECTSELF